jgi:hypothetical protein
VIVLKLPAFERRCEKAHGSHPVTRGYRRAATTCGDDSEFSGAQKRRVLKFVGFWL